MLVKDILKDLKKADDVLDKVMEILYPSEIEYEIRIDQISSPTIRGDNVAVWQSGIFQIEAKEDLRIGDFISVNSYGQAVKPVEEEPVLGEVISPPNQDGYITFRMI